ncbi:nicotinate-nucleotide--dimethylbenzimidazole phosphoribosyltransferase [Streptomyces sp. NPDC058045]|uniref:nicotinate-nucleotide--dimethylbenzimidazole phosphoribosyltransferase n=1 Tax=Streptomyces sp. NPDC058045 TaxID=3346311 RepID=UPI0036ED567F
MTETGQIPADGRPGTAGDGPVPAPPGTAAPGLDTAPRPTPQHPTADYEDQLLMPSAQGAWGEPQQAHPAEPGPHERSGRDSGAVDVGGVHGPAAPHNPSPRPLHLGPPVPGPAAGPVRSLADRGPAGTAPPAAPGSTLGPEYLDVPQGTAPEFAGPQLGEIPPQGAEPWSPLPPDPQQPAAPHPSDPYAPAAPAPGEPYGTPEQYAPQPVTGEGLPHTNGSGQFPAATTAHVPEQGGRGHGYGEQDSLGMFVPVEGSVPTTPHLAPTPPHALTLPQPAEEQAPVAVTPAEESVTAAEGATPVAAGPVVVEPVQEGGVPEVAEGSAAVPAEQEPQGTAAPVPAPPAEQPQAQLPDAGQPLPVQPQAVPSPAVPPAAQLPDTAAPLPQPVSQQAPAAEAPVQTVPAPAQPTAPQLDAPAEAVAVTAPAPVAPAEAEAAAESETEPRAEAEAPAPQATAPAAEALAPKAPPAATSEAPAPAAVQQPSDGEAVVVVPAPRDGEHPHPEAPAQPAAQEPAPAPADIPSAEPTEPVPTEPAPTEAPATEVPVAEAPTTENDPAEPTAEAEPAPAEGAPAEGARPEPAPAEGDPVPSAVAEPAPPYDEAEREAVLRVMRERRDIRNGFRPDPIPHEVLLRVLEAAHTAPSVGHSQPWDFVVIRSADTRRTMHDLAMRQRDAYAKSLPKGRAKQFKELKIEAILETPVNIVVTADPTRGGRHTLGRHTQPQMAPYSSALAVENLWLAARAEGLGVGWVSFFDEPELVRALGLPEHLDVVAYLCVGYVDEFPAEPELVQAGWSKRRPLSWVVHEETYGRRALPGGEPHDLLAETVAGIRPLDAKALGAAWERQKRMTKPAGALGMLEIISAQLCGLSRMCPPPVPEPAAVAVFAGDHGVHAQGVTPWPQEVTGQMVANFLGGGAVCNAFATQVGAEVCVVDVGVATELPATSGLLPRKVRAGTADMTEGPALTREEVKAAIEVGIETARDLVAAGNKALLTGEMGIANTTASAALISVYTEADPSEVTGRGTGINDETLARKTEVVRRALELHRPDPADPIGVLAAVGGLEHAAIVGLLLGGASLRTPVVLDGVSAGAAALVARAIAPEVLAACIAGHRSAEPGHVAALNKLGLRPLIDLDLRLGEGTGALLALPIVQSAARAMHEVATFDSAGVSEK